MDAQIPNCEFVLPDPHAVRQVGDFCRSFAVLIGVTEYGDERICLQTPANDVEELADLLRAEHGYYTWTLTHAVTVDVVEQVFARRLPEQIGKDDRLLIYFAGHGIAKDDESGPSGFLLFSPSDDDQTTPGQLRMAQLYNWLKALECQHLLLILDCCFAGAFRWSTTRHYLVTSPVLYEERYKRFLRSQAWQVITSTAHNQQALDVFPGDVLGTRSKHERNGHGTKLHSPFAIALFEALRGKADRSQDNVITATKLYVYLRDAVEPEIEEKANHLQTPGLWLLDRHESGEYIFLTPDRDPILPPDPQLDAANNPWRGLNSYSEADRSLFFGRDKVINELKAEVEKNVLTVVLGASGSGKSSVVKAGLLPILRTDSSGVWEVVEPMRPTRQPLQEIATVLSQLCHPVSSDTGVKNFGLASAINEWCSANVTRKLLLFIDQFEDLVTETEGEERNRFLAALVGAVEEANGGFHVVVTLRSDFESYFADDELLKPYWEKARNLIVPMTQDELRMVIEGPASEKAVYFDSPDLVDAIINEVVLTPGALPLLSFTLSELYLSYVREGRADRTLTRRDYKQIGGVAGSLRRRVEEIYDSLSDEAHRETMHRISLRMVSFEGGEATRRRVVWWELNYPAREENQRVATVLQKLVDARLLVTGTNEADRTNFVEPAHDRLVQTWNQLLAWYKAAADVIPIQRRVSPVANEWERAEPKERKALLWTNDSRLSQLHQILAPQDFNRTGWPGRLQRIRRGIFPTTTVPKEPTLLNGIETRFVLASVAARGRSVQRAILFSFVLLTILVSGIGVIQALQQEALRQRANSLAADSGRLAEEALQLARVDPVAAVQTSLSALPNVKVERPYVPYAEYALSEALQASQERQRIMTDARAESQVAIGEGTIAVAGSQLVLYPRQLAVRPMPIEAIATPPADISLLPLSGTLLVDAPMIGLVWAPDHTLLSYDETTLYLWDGAMLIAKHSLGNIERINCAVWRPDSQALAICFDDTVWIWTRAANQIVPLRKYSTFVNNVAWSPDGQYLAVVETGGGWVEPVGLAGETARLASKGFADDWTGVQFIDDSRLATWGLDGAVRLWSVKGAQLDTFKDPEDSHAVRGMMVMIDDARIVVYRDDGVVDVWQLDSAQTQLLRLEGHNGFGITHAAVMGNYLATAGADNAIYVWNLETGRVVTRLGGHAGRVHAVAWQPDQQHLLSYGDDGTLRLWRVFDEHGEPVCLLYGNDATDTPDCRTLVSASLRPGERIKAVGWTSADSGSVWLTGRSGHLLEWKPGHAVAPIVSSTEAIETQVTVHPSGDWILTYSPEGAGELWRKRGERWQAVHQLQGAIDNSWWGGNVLLLQTGGTQLQFISLLGDSSSVSSSEVVTKVLDAAIFGSRIALALADGRVRIQSVSGTGSPTFLNIEFGSLPDELQWNRLGDRLLAILQPTGVVGVWNANTGLAVWKQGTPDDKLYSVPPRWSPNGRFVGYAASDMLYVFDADNGEPISAKHETQIVGLRWGRDDSRLLTWDTDGRIQMWLVDVSNEQLILIGKFASGGIVQDAVLNSKGDELLTLEDQDGQNEVRIWHVWRDWQELVQMAKGCCVFP